MGKVIGFINIKGGVGKTTAAATVADILCRCGKQVLIVDNDLQCNISSLFGMTAETRPYTVADLYRPNITRDNVHLCISHTSYDGTGEKGCIDMIVSTMNLKKRVQFGEEEREHWGYLKAALQLMKDEYDYIIIDKNPSTDILSMNVLNACDEVIIPVALDGYSFQGLSNLMDEVNEIRQSPALNPDIVLRGLYLNRVKSTRSKLYKILQEGYREIYGDGFLDIAIRDCGAVMESSFAQKPLLRYRERTTAGEDYIKLVRKLGYITDKQYLTMMEVHGHKTYKKGGR